VSSAYAAGGSFDHRPDGSPSFGTPVRLPPDALRRPTVPLARVFASQPVPGSCGLCRLCGTPRTLAAGLSGIASSGPFPWTHQSTIGPCVLPWRRFPQTHGPWSRVSRKRDRQIAGRGVPEDGGDGIDGSGSGPAVLADPLDVGEEQVLSGGEYGSRSGISGNSRSSTLSGSFATVTAPCHKLCREFVVSCAGGSRRAETTKHAKGAKGDGGKARSDATVVVVCNTRDANSMQYPTSTCSVVFIFAFFACFVVQKPRGRPVPRRGSLRYVAKIVAKMSQVLVARCRKVTPEAGTREDSLRLRSKEAPSPASL